MKLTKKLLSTQVNSLRPYKSRSQRPCDFCRRRKTCCIIEKSIPCTACIQFNHGNCTFKEGPIKRINRNTRQKNSSISGRVKKLSHDDSHTIPHSNIPVVANRPTHINLGNNQSKQTSPIIQMPTPNSEVDLLSYKYFSKPNGASFDSENTFASFDSENTFDNVSNYQGSQDYVNQVPQNLMKYSGADHTSNIYDNSTDASFAYQQINANNHGLSDSEINVFDNNESNIRLTEYRPAIQSNNNGVNQYQLASASTDYRAANDSHESSVETDSSVFDHTSNYSSPSFQIGTTVEFKGFQNPLILQQNQQMQQLLQQQNQQFVQQLQPLPEQFVMNYNFQSTMPDVQYQQLQNQNLNQQQFSQQQIIAYLNLASSNVDLTNSADFASLGKPVNFELLRSTTNTNFPDF